MLYCRKQGHRKQVCRGCQRDEANAVTKPDANQAAKQEDIPIVIAENESPTKPASRTDNDRTNEQTTRTTRNVDAN